MTKCHAAFEFLLGTQCNIGSPILTGRVPAIKRGEEAHGPCRKKHGPGRGSRRPRFVAMAQQLLLLVLLLTAAASTCITALAAPASPPLPEAFLAFAMWALASTALAVHLPRARRGAAE